MTVEQSGSPARPSIWALLVGIDRYQALNPLRGCVLDLDGTRRGQWDEGKVRGAGSGWCGSADEGVDRVPR
jgi:hypothetical protein